MDLKTETINTWDGEKFELIISSGGYCFCPVCGEKSNILSPKCDRE